MPSIPASSFPSSTPVPYPGVNLTDWRHATQQKKTKREEITDTQKPTTREGETRNNTRPAMSRAAPVEIDFLGLEKGGPRAGTSSIRGIQDAVSKLDPQLLRTFLTFGAAAAVDESYCKRFPAPPMLPAMVPPSWSAAGSPPGAAAPLTIFYNGTVTVFDLPRHKAEAIIRWAETCNAVLQPRTEERVPESLPGVGGQQQQRPGALVDKLGGSEDIPLARRKSLHRFLEKRKERLTAALPCPGSTSSSSCDWAGDSGEDECGKSQKRQKKASSME